MDDLSDTIEGFYTLLKETRGIEERELDIRKDIFDNSGTIDDLGAYISEHIGDAAPGAEIYGLYSVQVPLDPSRFDGSGSSKFLLNNSENRRDNSRCFTNWPCNDELVVDIFLANCLSKDIGQQLFLSK